MKSLCVGILILISFAHHHSTQKKLSSNISTNAAEYLGSVVSLATTRGDLTSAVVDLKSRGAPISDEVSGRVLLSVVGVCDLPTNADIKFSAKIKVPQSYKNPGVFDYRDYLEKNNIWGKAFVKTCAEIHVTEKPQNAFTRFQQSLYTHLTTGASQGPILAALLLGTRGLDEDTRDLIQKSGLSHLFAISGMNFAIMGFMVFTFVSFVTKWVSGIFLIVPRQKIAAVATLVFVVFYLAIAIPQASLWRAGLMMATYLFAILTNRQSQPIYLALLAFVLQIIFDPLVVFGVSFQLSYLCIFILALIILPLQNFLNQTRFARWPKVVQYFLSLVLVSWCMNLLLIPLIAFRFGSVATAGLMNNIWAIPYFDFIVTPLALIYLILAIFSFSFAAIVLPIWNLILVFFLAVLKEEPAGFLAPLIPYTPHFIHILIFYVGIFLFSLRRKKMILVVTFFFLTITLAGTFYETQKNFDVRVTQIDVGQGDATLIQTAQKTVLIDAGGHSWFDVGLRVIKPFLLYEWVTKIDVAIITHPDTDHYLGFLNLIDEYPIDEFWISDVVNHDESYQQLLKKIMEHHIPLKIMSSPETVALDDKTKLAVLSPNSQIAALDSENDRSIVMKLTHENFSMLFTGDISSRAEKILFIDQAQNLRSDVLKVAHHGSKSSSSESFVAAVAPTWALIGVGEKSRFGHPTKQVLDRLQRVGAEVYRTDLNGAIQVNVQNDVVSVKAWMGD